MAKQIQAIGEYRPQIMLGKRAEMPDAVQFIARSTGLNESGIRQMLLELRDTTLFFLLRGQPIYLEGLGTLTPTIELDGAFNVSFRADVEIKNGLNAPGAFKGEIEHRENIGKSAADLAAMWNTDHPDDPVT